MCTRLLLRSAWCLGRGRQNLWLLPSAEAEDAGIAVPRVHHPLSRLLQGSLEDNQAAISSGGETVELVGRTAVHVGL